MSTPAAVDGVVAMADQLAGLRPAHRKAGAVDDVVQPGLQDLEQVFAGHALLLGGHFKIFGKLAFQHAVVTSDLLFLAVLQAVLGEFLPALAMLAGGVGAAAHRALVAVASLALEEELGALAAAQTANGTGISCHVVFTPPYIL